MTNTKNKIRGFTFTLFVAALAIVVSGGLLPIVARAQNVSKMARAGAYSLTLKVLPVESFTGPKAEMVRDGGAEPNLLNGPEHPNHHMVVFVKLKGKPVENATVDISYRKLSPHPSNWKQLPVVRMYVKGHGLATTHYGNNLKLSPGKYAVQVGVNGGMPATITFLLKR